MPAVVGLPVRAPVEALIDRPPGRPVADQVTVDPAWLSVAVRVGPETAVPDSEIWAAWAATVTVLVTVHVKDVVAE